MNVKINEAPLEGECMAENEKPEIRQEKTDRNEVLELRKALENKERQYMSLLADFDNFKKRIERDSQSRIESEKDKLINQLLDVLDNFERAIGSIKENGNDPLVEGILSIYAQLVAILKDYGVQRIDSLGKRFDPRIHEAMAVLETEDFDHNTIIDEMQAGYRIGNRLLRPSKVQVAL